MSYTITSKCIGCQRCLSACPTGAVHTDGATFQIDADHCNQCQGTYGVPQCWALCPTNDAIAPLGGAVAMTLNAAADPCPDYWEAWFATYTHLMARLKTSPTPKYWRQWFDTYAQRLDTLHSSQQPVLP